MVRQAIINVNAGHRLLTGHVITIKTAKILTTIDRFAVIVMSITTDRVRGLSSLKKRLRMVRNTHIEYMDADVKSAETGKPKRRVYTGRIASLKAGNLGGANG